MFNSLCVILYACSCQFVCVCAWTIATMTIYNSIRAIWTASKYCYYNAELSIIHNNQAWPRPTRYSQISLVTIFSLWDIAFHDCSLSSSFIFGLSLSLCTFSASLSLLSMSHAFSVLFSLAVSLCGCVCIKYSLRPDCECWCEIYVDWMSRLCG